MRITITIFFVITFFLKDAVSQTQQQLAKKLTSFNFTTLTGGTIILQARFDDFQDTLNFIFDTGSGGISLDSTTVAYYNLKPQKTDRIIKGIAGVKAVNFLYKHSLRLKGLTVDSLDFHINNYDILTNAYGVKINGVIGTSFLRRYIVKINYNINLMEVYEPGFVKYPKRGFFMKPNFSMLPSFNTEIAGNTLSNGNLIFDTGAGLNMLLTEDYVKDSNVLTPNRKIFETLAEGLGGRKAMQVTVINSLKFGPYKFKKVPTYIFKDETGVINYPNNMGIMGNDILRRFNLIINYPNKEIHLKPNSHFFDDFDYSYTGLNLYQLNGEIRIEDVVPNSPADKAGLKAEDIVFAIDHNFTQNMQAYKQALQNAGSALKILIIREGKPMSIVLNVAHLL